MEISNLLDRVKVMVIKMVTKLGTRMDKHSEKFNKELENTQKNQTELKGTIIKFKIH